nr:adhesion G protein-coupled receptor E5-like [Lytechinus pictus]
MLKIQIHMNLAICTALGQTLFLVLAEQTDNKTFCKGVTATLHYVFTSALAWTIIEGVFLYRTTAVGFKPLKIGWLCLLAYGGSFVVVGVSFGVLFETYGMGKFCWLRVEDNSIFVFAGCVFGTELFSVMILWFVMKVFSALKANKKKDEIDKIKATARALIILLPILGLTWISGTITSFTQSPNVTCFQYAFIICFSLQGVAIFVFHCLLVPDIKTSLKLRMSRRVVDSSWAKSRTTKSTTTTSF